MVDTTLAAQNVARMLAAKAKLGKVPEAGVPDKESSLFKQLKESVSKPTAQLTSNVLGNTFGPQKSNLPVGNQGPVVRNQTQGAGRFNVPRRTVG